MSVRFNQLIGSRVQFSVGIWYRHW